VAAGAQSANEMVVGHSICILYHPAWRVVPGGDGHGEFGAIYDGVDQADAGGGYASHRCHTSKHDPHQLGTGPTGNRVCVR